MSLDLHHHGQLVVPRQLIGARHPLQRVGQIPALFFNHAQLTVGSRRPQHVAHALKSDPGLVIPVIRLFQVPLLVVNHSQLPRLDADAAQVAHLFAVLHRDSQPLVGLVQDATRLRQRAQVMKLDDHLLGHAQAVAQAQRLLVPGLGILEQVLRVIHRSQGVEDVNRRFLVPVLFNHFPRPVVPAPRLVVFEPQVARRSQRAKVVDHLLVIGQPLVNVQRPCVPLLGGAVLALVVSHLPDGKTRVGD